MTTASARGGRKTASRDFIVIFTPDPSSVQKEDGQQSRASNAGAQTAPLAPLHVSFTESPRPPAVLKRLFR